MPGYSGVQGPQLANGNPSGIPVRTA
jgi:hypothetical protein